MNDLDRLLVADLPGWDDERRARALGLDAFNRRLAEDSESGGERGSSLAFGGAGPIVRAASSSPSGPRGGGAARRRELRANARYSSRGTGAVDDR